MYKVHNVNFDVFYTLVSRLVEVFGNLTFFFVLLDSVEVFLETFHQATFRLTHVLYAACFTRKAINQVIAFTGDIVFCHVFSVRVTAFYASCGVNFRTVSASSLSLAEIMSLSIVCGRSVLRVVVCQFGSDQHIPKVFWSPVPKDNLLLG